MAQVHAVKRARKDYPEWGIKKGDSYYWWQLYNQSPQSSLTYPKRQQLTSSSFLKSIYDIEDGVLNATEYGEDDLANLISELESLRDEQQDALDRMPEQLQDTSTAGELLTGRIEALEGWISDLESIDARDFPVDGSDNDGETEPDLDEDAFLSAVQDTVPGDWS